MVVDGDFVLLSVLPVAHRNTLMKDHLHQRPPLFLPPWQFFSPSLCVCVCVCVCVCSIMTLTTLFKCFSFLSFFFMGSVEGH